MQARSVAGMDGEQPDESDAGAACGGGVQPRPVGAETDQLIAAIVKLLARRVAREIIGDFDTGERP